MHAWEVAIVDVAVRDIRAVAVLLVDPLLPATVGVDGDKIVDVGVLVASRTSGVELASGGKVVLADRDVLAAPRDLQRTLVAVVECAFFDLIGLSLMIEGVSTSRSNQ